MEKITLAFVYILIASFLLNFQTIHAHEVDDTSLETYIVHVNIPKSQTLTVSHNLETYYKSFLPEASVSSNDPTPILIYSYKHVASGFAAKLTKAHLKYMEKKEGFLSARPQEILDVHTTHTPSFLGLHKNLGVWRDSNYGKGVIIGFLDTGITPNHPSFNDEGIPPPPKKWKGKCDYAKIVCNNKLIGARSFLAHSLSDTEMHGTHTSSIGAGNFVKGANVLGQANGTAVGMAPLAHVAVYQVCDFGCMDVNILAAMDAAIDDGVDIISISLGGFIQPLFSDVIALGAFAALQKGISVICSAGNNGPSHATVVNGAPWILTVGASTMDRWMRSTAILGNQKQYEGETLYQPKDYLTTQLPLIHPGPKGIHRPCEFFDSNDAKNIKGKVVVCELNPFMWAVQQGDNVKAAGGLGMIVINNEDYAYTTLADPHLLPTVHLSYAAGLKIMEYINSTSSPTVGISFQGTLTGEKTAPVVASFSARGPNKPSPGILKPDIIGPGVNVLAAKPFTHISQTRKIRFEILSGTSMSCPHLSGITALLKSAHPEWSPAAIKSAIMTTADIKNHEGNSILDEKLRPADMFAVGAGHVNVSRASDPGIIYDLAPDDYLPYLCGLNFTNEQVGIITHSVVNCSKVNIIPEAELNYPSFSVALGGKNLTYSRTVTNVGPAKSVYRSRVANPSGVEIFVKPKTLKFSKENEKLIYQVTFTRSSSIPNETYVQGHLVWWSNTSDKYVRSPLLVQLI